MISYQKAHPARRKFIYLILNIHPQNNRNILYLLMRLRSENFTGKKESMK